MIAIWVIVRSGVKMKRFCFIARRKSFDRNYAWPWGYRENLPGPLLRRYSLKIKLQLYSILEEHIAR